ncbi:hypothetical protein PDESU_06508 [Pontiella desulfatans]|uniref:Uncharacterized protein n=1 Tax=Pontiella desulfatans TaxID=2750659 RepID=A0A6C2UFC5_PONDE|nr:hypothetical protein PDESU_06508 [Pontiella desulfatans]
MTGSFFNRKRTHRTHRHLPILPKQRQHRIGKLWGGGHSCLPIPAMGRQESLLHIGRNRFLPVCRPVGIGR